MDDDFKNLDPDARVGLARLEGKLDAILTQQADLIKNQAEMRREFKNGISAEVRALKAQTTNHEEFRTTVKRVLWIVFGAAVTALFTGSAALFVSLATK